MSEQPSKEGSQASTSVRHRKRRRGGKTSRDRGSGQGSLGKALVSFLNWQQSAEERLLSLEEAQLEREWQAEERRGQREERRAEQERQHELQLFSMLTGALFAARQGAPAAPTDPDVSASAHLSASQAATATPPASSSLPQPLAEAPAAQVISTEEAAKSQPPPATACQMSQNVMASLRGAEAPGRSVYLSNRGNSIRQHRGILQEGSIQHAMSKYHNTDNPDVSEQPCMDCLK